MPRQLPCARGSAKAAVLKAALMPRLASCKGHQARWRIAPGCRNGWWARLRPGRRHVQRSRGPSAAHLRLQKAPVDGAPPSSLCSSTHGGSLRLLLAPFLQHAGRLQIACGHDSCPWEKLRGLLIIGERQSTATRVQSVQTSHSYRATLAQTGLGQTGQDLAQGLAGWGCGWARVEVGWRSGSG